jgi:hypothetical protein
MNYMKIISTKSLVVAMYLTFATGLNAQELKEVPREVKKETKAKIKPLGDLKIKFDEEGSKYLKFGFSNQIWLRSIENNPGTAVNGVPQSTTYDAGIRRMRITALTQLSSRYLLFFQIGINNQSFISGGGTGTGANGAGKKPSIFFHDAYNEFVVIPKLDDQSKKENDFSLNVGAGLHNWNGVSRLTNGSSSKILSADMPVFNFNTIEASDQFSRQLGVFTHGEWKRLGYRMNINKPFATNLIPKVGNGAIDNNGSGKLSFAGYFDYQFFDKEERITAALSGTHLGKKKMLNIGTGFYSTKEGTISQPITGVFEKHDVKIFGADVFADLPVGPKNKQMAITLYSVYYNYNFGPNYIRTTGLMNPGTADPNFSGIVAKEGFGNSKYLLGTGQIWYTQAGFLLPKFSDKVRIQPFATYAMKKFEALSETGSFYDLGTNFLLDGHNAKITMQYSSRPLYNASDNMIFMRAGEFLVAAQISF